MCWQSLGGGWTCQRRSQLCSAFQALLPPRLLRHGLQKGLERSECESLPSVLFPSWGRAAPALPWKPAGRMPHGQLGPEGLSPGLTMSVRVPAAPLLLQEILPTPSPQGGSRPVVSELDACVCEGKLCLGPRWKPPLLSVPWSLCGGDRVLSIRLVSLLSDKAPCTWAPRAELGRPRVWRLRSEITVGAGLAPSQAVKGDRFQACPQLWAFAGGLVVPGLCQSPSPLSASAFTGRWAGEQSP